MNTLNGTDAMVMISLIQAITFLKEGKKVISKMTASEYNFSDLSGLKKTFEYFTVGYSSKSKADAIMMIKMEINTLEEEKNKLENNYKELTVETEKEPEATPAELMALFIGA
jgi:hypothetical protein